MDFVIQTSDGKNKKCSLHCCDCSDSIASGESFYKHKDSSDFKFICKDCYINVTKQFYDYDDEADHGFRLVTKITQIKK